MAYFIISLRQFEFTVGWISGSQDIRKPGGYMAYFIILWRQLHMSPSSLGLRRTEKSSSRLGEEGGKGEGGVEEEV